MSKTFSLLKASMSSGLQLFKYQGKTERSRRAIPILLGTLIGVIMLFSANTLVFDLKEDGAATTILSLYTIVTSAIIVMEGIYKSSDLLFKPKDNDFLFSLPISKSTIIFTRIFKFYIFELLYCLIFLLPAIIAYIINVDAQPSFYLVAITMILFIPIIPIAVSCIIGYISTSISSRFKHRSILQVVLSFVALIAMSLLLFAANSSTESDGRAFIAAVNHITAYYYPAAAFVNLATNFDFLQYLLFIVINLLVIATTVAVISWFYFKVISRLGIIKQTIATSSKYNYAKHSQTFALIKKELNRYFSTPVLLTNTAFGLVLFIVAVILLCINYDEMVGQMMSSVENFPLTADEIHSLLPSANFVMVAFASLLTFISSTMISLEGKTFNFLKSLPISGHKVIMIKVLTAMLLVVPFTALGSIIMFIRFQFGLVEMLLILIAVITTALVTELIGILIDLKYARFDNDNDAVTVKQSAGTMVSTFVCLGIFLVTISLTLGLVLIIGQTPALIIIDAIFTIVSAFLYFVIATRGDAKFSKLIA